MSAYIDLTTNDYPLYIGDIELLGGLSERFASVQETPQPETSNEIISYEGKPEFIDGIWKRTWITRALTAEEILQYEEDKKRLVNFNQSDPSKIISTIKEIN